MVATSDYLRVERLEGVAVVTLDHQSDRNALSFAMIEGLVAVVRSLSSDGEIGAIVVAADGPVFSAGGSVDDLFEPKAPLEEMYAGALAVAESGVPTVAAVNGPALGAGMNLALSCDLIVCTPRARFETRFPQIGLHPGGGHLWHLRERIGRQAAAALSLFGEVLGGEEAAQHGLAWRCVPESELLDVAVALASRAAGLDRELAGRIRSTLDESGAVHRASDAVDLEFPAQQWSMERPEFAAALRRLRVSLGRES
jgi:enoyl-CoA hydratase